MNPIVPVAIALTAGLTGALPAQRLPNHVLSNVLPGAFAASGGFGQHGVVVPDFDGDGYEDIASAAPGAAEPLNSGIDPFGTVYVHSGRRGTLIRRFRGQQQGSFFGCAIDALGDINGDGVPELLVGAYDHDAPGLINNGRVTCFDGATATVLWNSDGEHTGNNLGESLFAIPDVTGDGTPDLVASAAGYEVGLAGRGRVVFLDGATGGRFADAKGSVVFGNLGKGLVAARDSFLIYASDYKAAVHSIGIPSGGIAPVSLFRVPLPGNHVEPKMALVRTPVGGYGLAIATASADTNGFVNNGTLEFHDATGSPRWVRHGAATIVGLGLDVHATRDVDGDGVEEILYLEGGLGLGGYAKIVSQDNSTLEVVELGCIGTVVPISIEDITGDGRGEWGFARASGVCGTTETVTMARGLEQVADAPGAQGYTASFDVDLGPANGGRDYWQIYSVSGTNPGYLGATPWPLIPINVDDTTLVMDALSGSSFTPDSKGALDSTGRATTNLFIPAQIVTYFTLTRTKVYTAVLAVGSPLDIFATSNPLRIPIR